MKRAKSRVSPRSQRRIDPEQPTAFWQRLFDLDQIESLLQASARQGQVISYSETLSCLGFAFSRPKMRALCAALGEVDRRAAKRGEPELAVLVVRASDKLPGAGWWVEKNTHDYNGPWEGERAQTFIRALQQKTFDYWKKR